MRSPRRTSGVRYCISWMAKVRKRGKAVLFIAQKRHRSCLGLPKWSSCKNLLLEEVTNAWLKADSLRCSCGAALALRKGQRYHTPPTPPRFPLCGRHSRVSPCAAGRGQQCRPRRLPARSAAAVCANRVPNSAAQRSGMGKRRGSVRSIAGGGL